MNKESWQLFRTALKHDLKPKQYFSRVKVRFSIFKQYVSDLEASAQDFFYHLLTILLCLALFPVSFITDFFTSTYILYKRAKNNPKLLARQIKKFKK